MGMPACLLPSAENEGREHIGRGTGSADCNAGSIHLHLWSELSGRSEVDATDQRHIEVSKPVPSGERAANTPTFARVKCMAQNSKSVLTTSSQRRAAVSPRIFRFIYRAHPCDSNKCYPSRGV